CSTPPAGSRSSSRSTPRSTRLRPRRPPSSYAVGARTATPRNLGAAGGRRRCIRPVDRKIMNSERLQSLLAEYAHLDHCLADPAVTGDTNAARKVGRRCAELSPIAKTAAELGQARADLSAARELADDPDFAAEAAQIEERLPELEERLAEMLMPRDPSDAKD